MANELIISVSGLRGIVGDTLTPQVAFRYATAFATTLPPGPVLVSRDGRANGPQLVAPVVAGLSQNGTRRVLDAGIAATPTTGVLVRHLQCSGGIQISASHNPAQYNGLKLFSAAGRVVPAATGEAVLQRYRSVDAQHSIFDDKLPITNVERLTDTTSAHLALIERIVDVDRIRQRRFRVLLDANHGCGSVLGRLLLERLGCDVTILGGTPDGLFAHEPEPTAENLASVLTNVTRVGADVGFCQDPDADRLAIIDERGAIHWRGVHTGDLRRSCATENTGARCDQLLHESNDGRHCPQVWRAVLSLGGWRSQRCGYDDSRIGCDRRRGQRRGDRSARRFCA